MEIKAWIDYLFWKRTWFRFVFILIPIVPYLISYLFCWIIIGDMELVGKVLICVFLIFLGLGLLDNNNMDGCDKPLKELL